MIAAAPKEKEKCLDTHRYTEFTYTRIHIHILTRVPAHTYICTCAYTEIYISIHPLIEQMFIKLTTLCQALLCIRSSAWTETDMVPSFTEVTFQKEIEL